MVKERLCQLYILLGTDWKYPKVEWSHGVLCFTVNNLNMLAIMSGFLRLGVRVRVEDGECLPTCAGLVLGEGYVLSRSWYCTHNR